MDAQIRSRSGLSTKGIFVINSPGTIDNDYRGEIKVILHNLSNNPYELKNQERIAQIIFKETIQTKLIYKQELSTTKRGSKGLGSTGQT